MTTATEDNLIEISQALQARLAEATAQLQQDRDRRAAKEARIVEVAHEEGTANGIGEALDDLLTEFDLPGRPWRTTLRLNLEWTQDVSSQRYDITVGSGEASYLSTTGAHWGWNDNRTGPMVSLNWKTVASGTITTPRDDADEIPCVCPPVDDDGYVQPSHEWPEGFAEEALTQVVSPLPPGVTVKIRPKGCTGDDCPTV